MEEDPDVRRRATVLERVYEELVAEIGTGAGRSREAELRTLAGDVESALNRCRSAQRSRDVPRSTTSTFQR